LDIQIREEFQKDDTMEEQKISLTQFLEEINGKLQGLSAEGEAQEAFELIDKNKDGLISMEELRAVLNTLGGVIH
jgi:Ca2+-binding EF-hand superfamily protein